MLRNVKDLRGYAIRATDGVIGHVDDFYFDDKAWAIRYLVAETGKWLPDRWRNRPRTGRADRRPYLGDPISDRQHEQLVERAPGAHCAAMDRVGELGGQDGVCFAHARRYQEDSRLRFCCAV
jgi:hypothetical protein